MDADYAVQESVSFAMSCFTKVAEKLEIVLKDKKMEAMLAFMSGCDVFVSLPTGFGKSFIYALLPMASQLSF